jgi:hypothetical protein
MGTMYNQSVEVIQELMFSVMYVDVHTALPLFPTHPVLTAQDIWQNLYLHHVNIHMCIRKKQIYLAVPPGYSRDGNILFA